MSVVTPSVGAVLVHYRFWPEFDRTLDALFAQTRPPDEVLVVDDCSGDGSVESMRDARPALPVVVAPHNRGAIANFNAGLRAMLTLGVDAVLLLTHETLLEPDTLERLLDRLEDDPKVAMAGPLPGFLSRPDTVFSAGGEFLPRTWLNPHAGMYESLADWRGRGARRVPWLDGACVLVRTAALADTRACSPSATFITTTTWSSGYASTRLDGASSARPMPSPARSRVGSQSTTGSGIVSGSSVPPPRPASSPGRSPATWRRRRRTPQFPAWAARSPSHSCGPSGTFSSAAGAGRRTTTSPPGGAIMQRAER